MRRIVNNLVLFSSLALVLTTATVVLADQVYHSERLDFTLTADGQKAGHPTLRDGHVVNIHPNGPVNGAIERYMINGAKPETSYNVNLSAFAGGCGGNPLFELTTTVLKTDKNGNAHGEKIFTPVDLAGLSGRTVGANWTLVSGGVDAYKTICTTVKID